MKAGEILESAFAIVLVVLALVFYFSNRRNLINRWGAFYLAISSIGVIKESFLYQIIPWVQSTYGDVIREDVYMGIYSVLTWVSYSFGVPAAFILGLYFYGLNYSNPKLLSIIKIALCVLALILSFFYPPLLFRTYQLESQVFWYVYSSYNVCFGIVLIMLMYKGIQNEKTPAVRRQKIMFVAVVLPPTVYVLITTFVIHALGFERWFKVWQWNIFIVALSGITVLVMAFTKGFLGLKLTAQNYDWDFDMDLVGRGANYTSHMIKTQTTKLELCIEQLQSQYENENAPEELAIMSRSISHLKTYIDRMKRHSQIIFLDEKPYRLKELLSDAIPASLLNQSGVTVRTDIKDDMFWICDKTHMTEVFSNIIANAIEAINGNGTIEITGAFEKSHYLLHITDTGIGINDVDLLHVFIPYFTTKNTEKNFGLGLSYCKNVIMKHGGSISAKSEPSKGTMITISFPLKRVAASGNERLRRNG